MEVTPERDGSARVFHMDCFVASMTGTPRDGDIWTYRIVTTPMDTSRTLEPANRQ